MSSFTQQADALVARGKVQDAHDLINVGVKNDNSDALFCLAIWYLVGSHVARDLEKARQLLRRAVVIGHQDAALFEIALTANGSGATPDWSLANQRLEEAALANPIAQQQVKMVHAMALDSDGNPLHHPPREKMCDQPTVYRYPALLSPAECAHLAMAARELLEPTTVFDPSTGRRMRHPVRTSSGAVIGPTREDLVIRAINKRFAMISGSRVEQGESNSILHYAPGEEYRPHFDFISGTKNQRIKTIIVYLNQGYGGGGTEFLANGFTVYGNIGDAIMFDNVSLEGEIDMLSKHAGLPVTNGTKWIATRWIRQTDFNPWTDG
jgi:prolyl 4-hydroxylase